MRSDEWHCGCGKLLARFDRERSNWVIATGSLLIRCVLPLERQCGKCGMWNRREPERG